MMSDIVERLRYQRTNSVICNEAATEIERLRERNTILFDALRALTKGKSMYFTESLGRTVIMDAQNSWMEESQ